MNQKMLPKDYLNFISKYEKSINIIQEDKQKWKLFTLKKPQNQIDETLTLVQELANGLNDDEYWDLSNRCFRSKRFLSEMLTIGRCNNDFLCIDEKGSLWRVTFDPRQVEKIAKRFEDWKIEVINLSNLQNNEILRSNLLGKWKGEESDFEFTEAICIEFTEGIQIKYSYEVKESKGKNILFLLDLEDNTEHAYELFTIFEDYFEMNIGGRRTKFFKA